MTDTLPTSLSDGSVAGSFSVISNSDPTTGTNEESAVTPNSLNINGMQTDADSLPSVSPGQNCPPSDSKSSVKHNHSLSVDKHTKSGAEKTGPNGSTGNGRSSNRSRSRHSSSSRSSGKKHSRYSDHRHKGSKSSPLPSESRSRKPKPESQQSPPVSETNHTMTGKHKVVSGTAEKRTRIVLHVHEEILQHGIVVDSKVKQTEFITSGGSVPWPPAGSALGLDDSSQTLALLPNSDVIEKVSNSNAKLPAVIEKNKSSVKVAKQESGVKRNSHKSISETPASKRVKNEGKSLQSLDNKEEDHRIEMASTLLSLQTESPVKKVERQDNFHEIAFLPLKQGSSCLAKWTDKNYYAGTLSSNLGDGRWHVLFDDGGKKAVNESDIICAPHLAIGQVAMASFSDGSLCVKGMVKQPFYEKNRLFYHVEYNDGSRNFTEKFSRRDIFLTADLAAALLNKQSKKSELSARFADVDLNNIIPKRSRLTAQSKALDGSTDDSEPESISSSVKSLPKSRKQFTPTKSLAISCSSSSNSHPSATSRHLAKSPIPETKPDPPQKDDSTLPREKITSAINKNAPPPPPLLEHEQQTTALTQAESPPDPLGPVPGEGSQLFRGITFLLTTADAGNANANDATDSGRSSALFDIPHLFKQIESGGGVVHQTLETAQEAAAGDKIILLAYTYLRTVKYMQCLAAGIPCVMHTWLIDCCRQNQLLDIDDYRLPSGYSIITNSLITDRSVFAKSSTLFNGVRFMLVSKNPRHAESWTSVLTAAKAVVVDDFPSSSGKASNSVDVIISDLTCSPLVSKKAQQMKIPIVSSEYVVQCLINGRRLSCEAHEKFGITHK